MDPFTFNIAKGRVAELYNRVKNSDPANCALVVVPIEAAGIESDATLIDKDTLADVFSGATNEQTTLGRIVLTDAELAAIPAPDDGNDRNDRSLPELLWAATAGNAIAGFVVGYDPDTTGGADSAIVPCTAFPITFTPNGLDLVLNASVFFRAGEPA